MGRVLCIRHRSRQVVNLFAGAAFVTGIIGGSAVQDILDGKQPGTPLERSLALHAKQGSALIRIVRLDGTAAYATGTLATQRTMMTSAHIFRSLASTEQEVRHSTKQRTRNGLSPVSVFFSTSLPEESERSPEIEDPVVDVVFHPDYIEGREHLANHTLHDIALLLLAAPAGPGYSPLRFADAKPMQSQKVVVVGYGSDNTFGKSFEAQLRIAEVSGLVWETPMGSVFKFRQPLVKISSGDSGGAVLNSDGSVIAINAAVDRTGATGYATLIAQNRRFLERALEEFNTGEVNLFKATGEIDSK
jgi:Trypsin-like peptidase domain